ncbi:MAG: histidine phosphatase family protein [Bryobacteraceae bacterium]
MAKLGSSNPMQIYLLRHGIAEDNAPGGRDADRALTDEGRRKLREVLALAKRDLHPGLIVTSPYLRAVQTAEIAIDAFGYREQLLRTDALIPSSDPEAVWDEIRVHQDVQQLLLVGHEPLFGRMASFLLNAPTLLIEVKKASILRIDVPEFGIKTRGVLKWMLVPKLAA